LISTHNLALQRQHSNKFISEKKFKYLLYSQEKFDNPLGCRIPTVKNKEKLPKQPKTQVARDKWIQIYNQVSLLDQKKSVYEPQIKKTKSIKKVQKNYH
jgi:hypothetical protein